MAIGWAFIGTGRHPDARVAPAMVLADDTKIIAAYSRNQERAEKFASKHGALIAYTSVEALLGDSRVDAVFIASPKPPSCSLRSISGPSRKTRLRRKAYGHDGE